ncbi:MAG: hypothetical protein ACI8ZN_000156 [Bacteroidia bacterium]|jgi:hypothetical protein
MERIRRFFIWTLFISLAFLIIFLVLAITLNFSEGRRAGELMKLSEKGILIKTKEGQLNTGGFSDDGGDITSSIWQFSVNKDDEQVLAELEAAMDGAYRVKLYYHEKYIKLFFLGDTKYFVYKVEKVGQNRPNP